MRQTPKDVSPGTKPPKLKAAVRKQSAVTLTLAGLTQQQIADEIGVDRKTINRDLQDMKATTDAVQSVLSQMQTRLRERLPAEKRIDEYVEMLAVAKETRQPSAGVQILARLDAIDGLVTDSERLRAKANETPQIVPMFALPEGTTVQVSVTTTPTGSGSGPNDDVITQARDVTPTKQSE